MNLNFFTSEFPFNNGEAFIENEIPIVSTHFDEVKIFPHFFNKKTQQRQLPTNCKVEQLEVDRLNDLDFKFYIIVFVFFLKEFFLCKKKPFYLKNFRKWMSLLKQAAQKAQFIEENDLLLKNAPCYSYWMNDWALVLAILKKRKVISSFVFRCGGFDIWDERHEGDYMPFRGLIYSYASGVYPNSDKAEFYIKSKQLSPQIVKRKYYATKDYGFNPIVENDEFTILSCANVIPLKRIHLIIEILSLVKRKVNWVHFGDGQLLEELKEKASLELEHHNFEFKGSRPNTEVLDFYLKNSVSLFITTSSTEGLPVTAQEAISFGVPVIGTDVGGMAEVVVNNVTGILIEKDFNVESVANIITNWENTGFNSIQKRKEIKKYWDVNFNANKVYKSFASELSEVYLKNEN